MVNAGGARNGMAIQSPGSSIDACSVVPMPLRTIRSEPLRFTPEHVTTCAHRVDTATSPNNSWQTSWAERFWLLCQQQISPSLTKMPAKQNPSSRKSLPSFDYI